MDTLIAAILFSILAGKCLIDFSCVGPYFLKRGKAWLHVCTGLALMDRGQAVSFKYFKEYAKVAYSVIIRLVFSVRILAQKLNSLWVKSAKCTPLISKFLITLKQSFEWWCHI